jgi:RNA polymerase sigma factor (sigma-70 family)
MTGAPLGTVLRRLHRALGRGAAGRLTDAELLERFVGRRDEAAFELLVRRHGPMVLGTCRRLLRHEHDAEDAFQATFLALARGAGSVRRRESVAGWLYRVARRVALKAKARAARRPERPARGPELTAPPPAPEAAGHELRPVLDEEVERLPEKYRAPVVLCYLGGLTCAEAARRLGCPRGTVATRLARARARLRGRLLRRGLGPAAVPPLLLRSATEAGLLLAAGKPAAGAVPASALSLAEGVTRPMLLFPKLKAVALTLLAVGLLAAGAGPAAWRLLAADPPDGPPAAQQAFRDGSARSPAAPAQNRPEHWVGYDSREMKAGPELAVTFEDGTSNVYPVAADAVLLAYLADHPYGELPVKLSVDLRDQNRFLVRFERPAGGKVAKAELVLTRSEGLKMLPPRPFEVGVYEVREAWDEGRVTWANQPKFAGRPAATARVDPRARELRIDVTGLARRLAERGAADHGWLLKVVTPLREAPAAGAPEAFRRPAPAPRDPRYVAYEPREAGAGPELVVTSEDGTQQTYSAEADAVLIAYLADRAYGSYETWLSVDLDDTNRVLLRFDPPAGAKVRKAELVLRAAKPARGKAAIPLPARPFELGFHEVREGWDEATVTWASQPRFAERPALKVEVDPKAKELRFDVTPLVRRLAEEGAPRHGWLLRVAKRGEE